MTSEDGVSGDWDATQYHKLVEGVDSCSDTSPIKQDGVVCGPTLRLKSIDYERDVWLGSMLIVVRDAFDPSSPRAPKVTYELGGGSHSGEFQGKLFHTDYFGDDNSNKSVFQFYRYDIELPLADNEAECKYTVADKAEEHYRFSSQGEIRTVTLSLTLAMGFPSQLIQPSSRARCGTIFCKSMLMYTTM